LQQVNNITSTAGQYSVKVDFGSCSSTPTITLEDVPFTSSLNVSATTIINEGENKTVIATAVNPVFEWYRKYYNCGATTNTLMLPKKAIILLL
jgi:hypothetical protein